MHTPASCYFHWNLTQVQNVSDAFHDIILGQLIRFYLTSEDNMLCYPSDNSLCKVKGKSSLISGEGVSIYIEKS